MASMARGGVASMACGGAEEEQEAARPPWPAEIDEAVARAEEDEAVARPPWPAASTARGGRGGGGAASTARGARRGRGGDGAASVDGIVGEAVKEAGGPPWLAVELAATRPPWLVSGWRSWQ